MDTITFGELKKHLSEKQCRCIAREYDKIVIFGNTYDMFLEITDQHIEEDYIMGIKIDIFEIVFMDSGEYSDVNISSCDRKVIIHDSFFNLERIPIKRYISISPVKSARN
jgi:hypothetical protein